MKLKVNAKVSDFQSVETLAQLLQTLNIDVSNGLAIALNYTVIPKEKWTTSYLNENDEITILKAVQGG